MSFSFGAKPAYGTGTATTFGTGSAFNSPAAFNSPTTFASPAAFNSPTAFGAPAATLGAPAGGLASSAPVSSFSAHPFQYIQQCYDPQNLNYRFRTYFYNPVEGGVTKYATPRPASISERLWAQILNDNPDPQRMIPIVANGFDDLKSRAAWQDEQMAAQAAKIRELEARMAVLLKKADLETSSQLQQIQKQQLTLVKRILGIMRLFEVGKRSGHKLQPAEEQLRQQVAAVVARLTAQPPLDAPSMRALAFQLRSLQEAGRLDTLHAARGLVFEDPANLDALQGILAEQQKGIKALTTTIVKDAKDLELMRYGFQF